MGGPTGMRERMSMVDGFGDMVLFISFAFMADAR